MDRMDGSAQVASLRLSFGARYSNHRVPAFAGMTAPGSRAWSVVPAQAGTSAVAWYRDERAIRARAQATANTPLARAI